jgi:hypothetical protein
LVVSPVSKSRPGAPRQVDPPVPPAVLDALLKIEALLEVKLVKLPNGGN